MQEAWEGFVPGRWVEEIDVRDFIQKNYTPYYGGGEFLKGPYTAPHITMAFTGPIPRKCAWRESWA